MMSSNNNNNNNNNNSTSNKLLANRHNKKVDCKDIIQTQNDDAITITGVQSSISILRKRNNNNKNRTKLMYKQMYEYEQYEKEQNYIMKQHGNILLNNIIQTTIKSLVIIIMIGIILYLYFQPKKLLFLNKNKSEQRLPSRTIITIYPSYIHIEQALPRFFMSYSIVTEKNQIEREYIQYVAKIRKVITNSGRNNQKITFLAYDHDQFQNLYNNSTFIDKYCGNGFYKLYKNQLVMYNRSSTSNNNESWIVLDDLVLWCLIQMGKGDGYIKISNTNIINPMIIYGTNGIVSKRYNENIIYSNFIILPILNRYNKNNIKQQQQPSTNIPTLALQYLLQNVNDDNKNNNLLQQQQQQQQWEEYLYEIIINEINNNNNNNSSSSWILFNAACTKEDKLKLENEQKQIAMINTTSCNDNNNDDNVECYNNNCTIYDPMQKPFSYYKKLKKSLVQQKHLRDV